MLILADGWILFRLGKPPRGSMCSHGREGAMSRSGVSPLCGFRLHYNNVP